MDAPRSRQGCGYHSALRAEGGCEVPMVWPPACGDKARWFGDGDSRVLSVCVGVPRSVTHDAMVFLFFRRPRLPPSVIKNHPRRSPADEAGLRLNVRFGGEVSAFLSEMVEGVTGVCRFMSDYAAAAVHGSCPRGLAHKRPAGAPQFTYGRTI